ncbi:MAG: sugar transferase [Candidatus Geothermincolia bacterium]
MAQHKWVRSTGVQVRQPKAGRVPGKRLFDVVVSATALLVLLPLMTFIALLVKSSSPGPVLYRAPRVGRNGRPFKMYKFRSMVVGADEGSCLVTSTDPRVTGIGAWLRHTKLDELPQLLNVLRGNMSLVGPRPEVVEYVELYGPQERQILLVRPGITDWASLWNSDEGGLLNGFDDPEWAYLQIIWPMKLQLQRAYVCKRCWRVDLKILFFTFLRLAGGRAAPREVAEVLEGVSGQGRRLTPGRVQG